jgi:hypothetical protein
MNRSFHAFAVLLVSLAGGMIAATWTSTLPTGRPVLRATAKPHAPSTPLHCSCNPDGLVRFENGCGRDKTTGELHPSALGLGKDGRAGITVIGSAVNSLAKTTAAIRNGIASFPWPEVAAQARSLEASLAAIQSRMPGPQVEQEKPADRTHEQEYAAAELAAASFDPDRPRGHVLNLNAELSALRSAISADSMSRFTKATVALLGTVSRRWERQSRLWLVENDLHRQWDAAEKTVMKEQTLATARLQVEVDDFERWFENFPSPVTQPNRLNDPSEPKDKGEESRRIILATAKALEGLSRLLHQTAENLARHAEQDVAKSHNLKSPMEERR